MKCLLCDGEGKYTEEEIDGFKLYYTCYSCDGSGKVGLFSYLWQKRIIKKEKQEKLRWIKNAKKT